MVICQQYSSSLERRKGFWEAFHHWLETRDFLVSEFKTRRGGEGKKEKSSVCTCVHPCVHTRVHVQSQRHIIQFLYSVISAKRGEEKKTMRHTYLYSRGNRICRLISKLEIIPVNNAESCDAAAEQGRLYFKLVRFSFGKNQHERSNRCAAFFVLMI